MPALLMWLGRYLLGTVASEVFKRGAIFIAFNIVLSFMISFITDNHFGLQIFGLGNSIGNLFIMMSSLGGGVVLYVLEKSGGIAAIFLVMNAYLARFAYRMTFKALGR